MQHRACERWGEWSTEAIGNQLPPVIISHLSLLLWKRSRTAWEEAMCSRQTERGRKGLMWLRCPESISDLSRLWQHSSSSGDWHMSISLMFCLSGFLLSTDFKNIELVTVKMWELLKIPERPANTFWVLYYKTVWGPVRIWRSSLWDMVGVPVWLQNSFAIKSSSKPCKFLKADRQKK